MHSDRPDAALPGLIEEELLRLSVVAFAMFHRLRLWTTTDELDADLAGLGLPPTRRAGPGGLLRPADRGPEDGRPLLHPAGAGPRGRQDPPGVGRWMGIMEKAGEAMEGTLQLRLAAVRARLREPA